MDMEELGDLGILHGKGLAKDMEATGFHTSRNKFIWSV